jgi:hypothetical protein
MCSDLSTWEQHVAPDVEVRIPHTAYAMRSGSILSDAPHTRVLRGVQQLAEEVRELAAFTHKLGKAQGTRDESE